MRITMRNLISGVAATAIAMGAISGGSAGAVETGQLLIKDKPKIDKKAKTDPNNPNPPTATEKQLCGVPYTPPCRADASPSMDNKSVTTPVEDGAGGTPPAADFETGQLLIKDKIKPSAARKSNNGWVLPTIGAAAALGAIFAVSAGGNDRPTSP